MSQRSAFVRQLTALTLIAAVVALGAWQTRRTLARRAAEERQRERAIIATAVAQRGDFQMVAEEMGALEAVRAQVIASEVSGQVLAVIPNGVKVQK